VIIFGGKGSKEIEGKLQRCELLNRDIFSRANEWRAARTTNKIEARQRKRTDRKNVRKEKKKLK
jgi:hypothetical protein